MQNLIVLFVSSYYYKKIIFCLDNIQKNIPNNCVGSFIIVKNLFIQSLPKNFKLYKGFTSVEHYLYIVFLNITYHKILYQKNSNFLIKIDKDFFNLHNYLLKEALQKGYYTKEEYNNEINLRDELIKNKDNF